MKINDVAAVVDGIPHMSVAQATTITEFVREHGLTQILELGFRHGVSTCYLAGTLEEMGAGHITTIDLDSARAAEPNVETLLERLGLRDFVEVFYEPTSYIWRMMKMLEEDPSPRFDFCYLDGAHNWFVDGFAFFLVDRFLKPGGWIVLDDLYWTYASSPSLKETEMVRNMVPEERDTAQVEKVYQLLVRQHPDYDSFMVKDGWAFARKRPGSETTSDVRTEVVYQDRVKHVGLGAALSDILKKLLRR